MLNPPLQNQNNAKPVSVGASVGIHRKQTITLAVAIVLFVLALGFGITRGFSIGKDQANLQNVSSIYTALKYFNQDQDRYPTQDEFENQRILVPYYLRDMPVPANVSGTCGNFSNYAYSQPDPQSFALQFCLNNGINGWSKGLNTIQNGQ